ncbi:mitochondrial ribosomal protein L2 [Ptiloglossa arizonensis]|uniref:mitochondrial ribosomal protein L2 n=1 Tax=Ptiloglossa arizonensis TaxID=3350558 RepID=UPI003F9EF2A9
MAVLSLFRSVFFKQVGEFFSINVPVTCQAQRRTHQWNLKKLPKPGVDGISYRRIVHFKDEYTVEPLKVTNLAGRDPVSGRVIANGIGGGVKHKYHWIYWIRNGPTDLKENPREDRVLAVFKDGCRTSYVALIGSGRELRYILATENMKVGDIIKTHQGIPRNPIRPNEGDAYPLGALPHGTVVNCVEKYPGFGGCLIHAAGTYGTIVKRDDNNRVLIKMPSKKLFNLDEKCMATVGRLSNILHGSTPIGSAQKNRELGNRPRSGLRQKKTGRCGRKVRRLPPPRKFDWTKKQTTETLVLNKNSLRSI